MNVERNERPAVLTPLGGSRGRPPADRQVLGPLGGFRELMVVVVIAAGSAGMWIICPDFRTWDTLTVVLLAVATQAIVAIGMTALLVAGGFDLSVGSTAGLAGAVAALCMVNGLPVPVAILAGLALGALVGLLNGLIIAHLRINAFITTLAMMGIVRGALEVITQGKNIHGLPGLFKRIGQDCPLGIRAFQYPIIISLAMVVLGDLALRKLRFFRNAYYIGGNEKAAVLSGINVAGTKMALYALTGFLAALAGILTTARFGSASVTMGNGLELQVIAAVIIGGASLAGGEGTVLGSFLGCVLMALIVSSLTLLGVDIYWQRLIIGTTLLAAVLIDMLGKRVKGTA